MSNEYPNPALEALLSSFSDELIWAQVRIQRAGNAFELRHIADTEVGEQQLRTVPLVELRALAQRTATGAFRPLKSAPNLPRGWRALARGPAELAAALRDLYPGSLADWFVSRGGSPPLTDYRSFTERQTGMYRITTKLSDAEAAQVIRACCHQQFCLKQRLWTVGKLPPDAREAKSAIPCLEPCAVLLEFARTAVRMNQAEPAEGPEPDTLLTEGALLAALERPEPGIREADFNSRHNPRRVRLLLEKLLANSKVGGTTV